MKRSLLVFLLGLAQPLPALPQTMDAPIQTAQAEKPAAVEESVALPEPVPVPWNFFMGVAIGVAILALGLEEPQSCDDASSCGGGFGSPTSTR